MRSYWKRRAVNGLIDAVIRAGVLSGLPKQRDKLGGESTGLRVTHQNYDRNCSSSEWQDRRKNRLFLYFCKVTRRSLLLNTGHFLVRFGKFLFKTFNFHLATCLCCVGLLLSLSGKTVVAGFDQRLFSLAINESHNFTERQKENEGQGSYVTPKIDASYAIERIPCGQREHDYTPLIIAWIASLLFTMKLTALIVKRR